MADTIDVGDRQYVRRKKSAYDMVIAAGSVAGAMAAIGVVFTTLTDQIPFERKIEHALDMQRLEIKIAQARGDNQETKVIVQGMQRDQWRVLQLTLQQRVEALTSAINEQPAISLVRQQLVQARAEIQQQLADVSMRLQR